VSVVGIDARVEVIGDSGVICVPVITVTGTGVASGKVVIVGVISVVNGTVDVSVGNVGGVTLPCKVSVGVTIRDASPLEGVHPINKMVTVISKNMHLCFIIIIMISP
jgi:hypothetical protein